MSHFSVLVIGENVDEKLDPYSEELKVAPYKVRINEEELKNMEEHYKIEMNYKNFMEKIKDWCGYIGDQDDEGFFYWSTYNPNSKWDWYEKGGRWAGMLILKDGKSGERGRPGLLMDDFEYKEGEVDEALFGDIDWEKMRNKISDEELEKEWEEIISGENKEFYSPKYYLEQYKTKENYIKRRKLFHTYAVVTENGVWHEPGTMGWWGMRKKTCQVKPHWELNFWDRFLKDLSPDTLITIVDAHI